MKITQVLKIPYGPKRDIKLAFQAWKLLHNKMGTQFYIVTEVVQKTRFFAFKTKN